MLACKPPPPPLKTNLLKAIEPEDVGTAPPPFPEYANDPVGFCREVLGDGILTDRQIEILESVRDNQTTNVQAGNGVGKTYTASRLVLWWVFSLGGMCVTTAPSKAQVQDLLWKEVRVAYDLNRFKLGGERFQLSLRWSETAFATGFTARAYSTDSFQGRHAEHLLAILDESNGISKEIDEGAIACITGRGNRLLRIGNPTSPGTEFHAACKYGHLRLAAWEHPNVAWAYGSDHKLLPDIHKAIALPEGKCVPRDEWPEWMQEHLVDPIPGAVSIEWIEQVRYKKSENSPFWIARLDAQFPTDNEWSVIPPELVSGCKATVRC